jgi:PIN domain nuclease of toxin-antitoxin system
LLLDTHVFLWWLAGSPRLGSRARTLISSADADLTLSVASWWEIGIKTAIGRMTFDWSIARSLLEKNRIKTMLVTFEQAEAAAMLPLYHRDPFDRMLVAQAEGQGLKLLTRDRQLKSYGPSVLCV